MTVRPIPEGYHSLTPYLIVKGGAKALDFYSRAFGARELFRMPQPDGRIGSQAFLHRRHGLSADAIVAAVLERLSARA